MTKSYLVHTNHGRYGDRVFTYVEREGRLYMLHPYEFACEDTDGTWVYARIWCDGYEEVLNEAKFNAGLFGTGRFRIHDVRCGGMRDDGMWRDERGVLHVTRRAYYDTSNDFRGMYSDIYGEHPELRGKRTLMPPLCLGYTSCLLIEGVHLVIEEG